MVGFIRGQSTPTQAETTALLAAMTVQPSAGRTALINDTIFQLKNAGLWATFDFFIVFAAHHDQAGRINWVNPAQVASVLGGPLVFTFNQGFASDGTSSYLGAGVLWSALTKFTQDSAAIGVWATTNVQSGGALIGQPTTARALINPRTGSDLVSSRLNSTGTNTVALPGTDGHGHTVTTRSGAAGYDVYRAGSLLTNFVAASVARVAEEVVFLRSAATFSNAALILGIAHGGSALTGAQISTLNGILSTYMGGVGSP